ncbi:Transcription elongation factor SPT6 [Zancudomyces culisetae]|uniref:Transcription elongation factor SPT6 n=1 Tax=Zancudomyces culisetae TaxID=1213189 RepID=A0A1R1PKZ2_ZANCU|nr:Transcription elongation factor SPT6 [Zancudomyces culisetae]|eukprot:OMH81626.1 Transcription elongation factor SPT6 [Zancudomyces culisetae]
MRRGARERRGSDDEEYGRGRGRGRREDLGLFDDEEEEEDDREDERRRRGREDARRQRGRRERREEGLEDFIEDESEGEEGGRERERERPKRGRADWGGFGDEIMEGLDEDTMYDLLEIFGDGTEYDFAMEERRPEDEVVEKEGILDRVFEPAEIEAKMLTTKDEEIRVTDCPERLQERGSGAQIYRRELSDEEIEEETTWILRQLNRKSEGEHYQGPSRAIMGHERFLAAVLSVLKLMSQEFMEVPFIYTHRKDLFETSESGDGEQRDFSQAIGVDGTGGTGGECWRVERRG